GQIADRPWRLDIVGDGAARPEVERLFAGFDVARVRWHGALKRDAVIATLARSDVFAWPGIGEAFGMAYLEAQAAGVPVAAVATAGVPAVVMDGIGGLLAPQISAEAYAAVLARLINDTALRTRLAESASDHVRTHHAITTASRVLDATIARLAPPSGR
ncbi:MAG: glycosyltransferase, partial [Pseudomonadota bacterium]